MESEKYFSQFERVGYCKNDAVHLAAGAPGAELLKMLPPMIEAATKDCMKREMEGEAHLFQYGVENGDFNFRSFLASFLSEEYGDTVNREQLFLTGGASSGLWLALSAFFKSGSVIFVEDPSYFLAVQIFRDLHMNIVPVKTDDHGIVVDALQEKLTEYFFASPPLCSPPLRAMVYLIPTFHNPTGSVLPEDRCQALVKLARKFGVMILCDDVYNLLHHQEEAQGPKRLFMFDQESDPDYAGNVISNGSFSKFLGPGLRMGWMEVPQWAVQKLEDFGVISSGGGLNTFTSGIVTSLLSLGKMKEHLHKLRALFKVNMQATADLLRAELPSGCKLKSPATGGYFLWIELPESIPADKLLPFAKQEFQVDFMFGQRASVSNGFRNYLRICISFYPKDVLLLAVRRLCQAISAFDANREKIDSYGPAKIL